MAETILVSERLEINDQQVEQKFSQIVQQIETVAQTLTAEEGESLNATSMRKPGGTADQGYRHG